LPDTAKHAIILWALGVSGKLPNSCESANPMSDFIQQLFETLQLDVAEETSEAVGTGLSFTAIILLALAAYILTRFILLRILVRFYARTKSKAGEILLEKKVFHRLTLLVPAVVLYLLAPLVLEGYAQTLSLLNRILGTYAIIITIPTINAALNALNVYYETLEVSRVFPITSIVQVAKVVAFGIAGPSRHRFYSTSRQSMSWQASAPWLQQERWSLTNSSCPFCRACCSRPNG
jgi:hypothetical protein